MKSILHYLTWDESDMKKVSGEVRRRVMTTRNVMVVQYKYEPGDTFPEHHHPQEQIILVIEGNIEFEVNGEKYEIARGGLLVIPSNAPHSSRVIGKMQVVTFNIFHPIREDLLDEVSS